MLRLSAVDGLVTSMYSPDDGLAGPTGEIDRQLPYRSEVVLTTGNAEDAHAVADDGIESERLGVVGAGARVVRVRRRRLEVGHVEPLRPFPHLDGQNSGACDESRAERREGILVRVDRAGG
jgi:hypothetical protein